MANGLNRVQLLGNLGSDPELRYTQSGQPVLNIRLATTESYLDKNKVRQERTEWHSVTLWGNRAEALSQILKKGSQILVEGRLQTSSYEDRDGNKRSKTEVVALNVILTGRKGDTDGGDAGRSKHRESGDGNYGLGDDDIGF